MLKKLRLVYNVVDFTYFTHISYKKTIGYVIGRFISQNLDDYSEFEPGLGVLVWWCSYHSSSCGNKTKNKIANGAAWILFLQKFATEITCIDRDIYTMQLII